MLTIFESEREVSMGEVMNLGTWNEGSVSNTCNFRTGCGATTRKNSEVPGTRLNWAILVSSGAFYHSASLKRMVREV